MHSRQRGQVHGYDAMLYLGHDVTPALHMTRELLRITKHSHNVPPSARAYPPFEGKSTIQAPLRQFRLQKTPDMHQSCN